MHWSFASFLPLALLPLARAQGTVQDLWDSPEYPDYTTNYTAGTTVEISWQPALATQFQFFCEDCDITNVDLWVTGTSYTRKLESGVNVNTTTSYEWEINISDEDVEASLEWTFRFLPADVSWADNDQEISSAKFNLNPRPNTPTPSPTPSPTTTSTGGPADPTAPQPADPNTPSEGDSLSTGAKAGIGVGVSAGGLIIIALAFLLWRRLRALPPKGTAADPAAGAYNDLHHPPPPGDEGHGFYAPPPAFKAAPPAPLSELAGVEARELDAGTDSQRPPAELDGGSPVRR
ncbi:hypothetical protein BDV12DRAFT_183219 [Aspergillus spectabilis]